MKAKSLKLKHLWYFSRHPINARTYAYLAAWAFGAALINAYSVIRFFHDEPSHIHMAMVVINSVLLTHMIHMTEKSFMFFLSYSSANAAWAFSEIIRLDCERERMKND